jgi:membrane protein YqaA with SNARE-associated domain
MEELVLKVIDWFALPKNGLVSVFVVAFMSATLLPLGSEPAVFAYVKLNPDQYWLAILVATVGNTLGGAVDYWMGRGAKRAVAPSKSTRYLKWFERLGPKALFFSFLPVVGDPLCAVAGWLKLPFWPSVAWMAVGKFSRYLFMTSILLWIPNEWWGGAGAAIRSAAQLISRLFGGTW